MSKIPEDILRLTDDQLRQQMIEKNLPSGPITETTRKAYQKRLAAVWGQSGARSTPTKSTTKAASTPTKATPRRSPKKQSLAAMSSEEEDEEVSTPYPPKSTRQATPPKRKSALVITPVLTPQLNTNDRKKSATKVVKKIPKTAVVNSYDTGSDSDGQAEQIQDTKRTTHSYWRQSFSGANTPVALPSSSPQFMSEYGRQLSSGSSSFNGHSSRVEPPKKIPTHRTDSLDHSLAHKFATKILPLLLATFFGYLAYCYVVMQSNPQDATVTVDPFWANIEQDPDSQFPLCKGTQVPGINCILSVEVRPTLDSLKALVPKIKQMYIDAICSKSVSAGAGPDGSVEFDWMEKMLEARGNADPESTINNIRVLIRSNPKWGMQIVNQGKAVSMTNVHLPTLCFLKLKAAGFFIVFLVVFLITALLGLLVWCYKTFANKAAREEAVKKALISRIKDRMESTETTVGPYVLPIDQLRDELLGAHNVEAMELVWDAALKSVLEFDSKIRMETKIIGGEEADCLVWVHSKSPKQNEKYSRFDETSTKSSGKEEDASSQSSRDHPGMWQGQAFENVEGSFNSPPVSPTQCLKIRQIPAGSEGVVDAILEKCGQNVNILHIKLDTTANDCCVYMKTASQPDAGRAFRALHGWWFDGNLVTVKFLRLERYHERFPESIHACIPLRPSNNQKRSLQGKLWEDRTN